MWSYVARRLLWMVPAWIGVTLIVFLAVHTAPGDPIQAIEGHGGEARAHAALDDSARAALRERFLLDRPLWQQYLHFLGPLRWSRDGHAWLGGDGTRPYGGALLLDFGTRFESGPDRSVSRELAQRLSVTLPLALAALVAAFALAIPLGVLAALMRGRWIDRAIALATYALYSMPSFWLALVAVAALGPLGLDVLPVVGLHGRAAEHGSFGERSLDLALHALLPVALLAHGALAYVSRQVRANLLETLHAEFSQAARARGLSETRVVWAHALRNALLPSVTLLGGAIPGLVGGSLAIESVFGIPGMGQFALEAFSARDYNAVMGVTAVAAGVAMLGLLLSDLAYAWLDPRVRHGD